MNLTIASLERLARAVRDLPARRRYRNELRQRSWTLPVGGPVVAFGEPAPQPGDIVHGGRVKLLHLRQAFEWSEERFNLVYLVSSAIPPFADEWLAWAKSRGAKLVWNQNGVGFPAWAGARTSNVNLPMAKLLAQADHVVYQSDFCRTSADRYLGAPNSPSTVLFNPVDLSAFSPNPNPPVLDEWRLLTAGTHNQPFRVLGAIEVVRELRASGRPASLTIAGDLHWRGADAEVRRAIDASQLGAAIELRPRFTQAEAVELLRSSHLLLHPKFHDPCPTMVIEALACGIPIIGSRSGGLPELVGADGSELIEVPLSWEQASYPNPTEIAAAAERIMGDWPARSRAARARAERLFDSRQWVEAHRRIFAGLL